MNYFNQFGKDLKVVDLHNCGVIFHYIVKGITEFKPMIKKTNQNP